MSFSDYTNDDLLKEKKKNKIGIRGFSVLFIFTLLLYELEELTKFSWLVFSIVYVIIITFFLFNIIRINKEIKRRDINHTPMNNNV